MTTERCLVIPTGEHESIDKSCTSLFADSYRETQNPSPNKTVGKQRQTALQKLRFMSASNRSSTSGTQCVMVTLNANTTRVDLQEDIQRAALSVRLRLNQDLFTLFLFWFVVRHLLLNYLETTIYYHVYFLSTFVTNDVKRMTQQLCDSNLMNSVSQTVDAKRKTNPAVFAVLMCHWVIFMGMMICDKMQRYGKNAGVASQLHSNISNAKFKGIIAGTCSVRAHSWLVVTILRKGFCNETELILSNAELRSG